MQASREKDHHARERKQRRDSARVKLSYMFTSNFPVVPANNQGDNTTHYTRDTTRGRWMEAKRGRDLTEEHSVNTRAIPKDVAHILAGMPDATTDTRNASECNSWPAPN
jgi:hypothetical protein